MRTYN